MDTRLKPSNMSAVMDFEKLDEFDLSKKDVEEVEK